MFGALLVLFSQARTLWVAIAILIPMGMASMIQMTSTNALIQTMTPDALRGRVMAIWFVPPTAFRARPVATSRTSSRTRP